MSLTGNPVARGTREQADAEIAADGVRADKPEEPLSAEASVFDREFPPVKAANYEFPLYGAPGEALTPEQQTADAMFRGWLTDARFSRDLGSSLAKTIDQEATALAKMSAIERTLYGNSQRLLLDRTWGAETQEKISLARQLVRELEARRPGLLEFVERTGVGDSASVVTAFAAQAERLAARRDEVQGMILAKSRTKPRVAQKMSSASSVE